MNTAIAPKVEITLDRPRRLLFDFNAKVAFEEATGASTFDPKTFNLSSKVIRALLWAGLLHENPMLTLQEAGAMITRQNEREVSKKVFEAWRLSLPELKEEAGTEAAANPPRKN